MSVSDHDLVAVLSRMREMSFWDTEQGREWLAVFDERIATPLALWARRSLGFDVTTDDVLHTLIIAFATERSGAALERGISDAQHPWGYLWTCTKRLVRDQADLRAYVPDDLVFHDQPVTDEPVIVEGARWSCTAGMTDWSLLPVISPRTALGEAVAATVRVIAPRVPAALRSVCEAVVSYLALNPHQHQHQGHGHTDATRDPNLLGLGLTPRQAGAFATICWGARGRPEQTSVLGAVLRDPEFTVSMSPSHMRALCDFEASMNDFRAERRVRA